MGIANVVRVVNVPGVPPTDQESMEIVSAAHDETTTIA